MVRSKKGLLLAFITFILCLNLFSLNGVLAKAKVQLADRNLSLYTNQTQTITLKNAASKVKWTSSNKKVAAVIKTSGKYKKTAKIKTGNITGKCTIRAKIGKKVYKCRVTVKSAKPSKVTIAKITRSADKKSIKLNVVVFNGTNAPIGYKTDYTLEKYQNGKWVTVPKLPDYLYWPSYIDLQDPQSSFTFDVDLKYQYDLSSLTPGKYRFCMEISNFNKNQRSAEFKIS